MDKVKLPKEVADELEKCRQGHSDKDVISIAIADHLVKPYGSLQAYANEFFDQFMSALVNGYEVEQTPEDKVREYITNRLKEARSLVEGSPHHVRAIHRYEGAASVAEMLGIKIEGVNA